MQRDGGPEGFGSGGRAQLGDERVPAPEYLYEGTRVIHSRGGALIERPSPANVTTYEG